MKTLFGLPLTDFKVDYEITRPEVNKDSTVEFLEDYPLKHIIMTPDQMLYAKQGICPQCHEKLFETSKGEDFTMMNCKPCNLMVMVEN